jgi:hypothetical protein
MRSLLFVGLGRRFDGKDLMTTAWWRELARNGGTVAAGVQEMLNAIAGSVGAISTYLRRLVAPGTEWARISALSRQSIPMARSAEQPARCE